MIVQQNKTVYFGARKWIAGEPLPPFLSVKMAEPEPEIAEVKKPKTSTKTSIKKADANSEEQAF